MKLQIPEWPELPDAVALSRSGVMLDWTDAELRHELSEPPVSPDDRAWVARVRQELARRKALRDLTARVGYAAVSAELVRADDLDNPGKRAQAMRAAGFRKLPPPC